ncbi:MAG: ATPase domain-containing protein [Myxococcota bacterium]
MTTATAPGQGSLICTGVPGLDTVLGGGLPRNRMFLVQGAAGAGKTTLGLSFLLEGLRNGEPGLYVTLSETREELEAVAASHGWSLAGLTICESPGVDRGQEGLGPSMFHSAESELTQTIQGLLREVERVKPARVVFDSLSELRLLAGGALRYRRHVLGLKQFFAGRSTTVLLVDDGSVVDEDSRLQSLVHGVLELEQVTPDFGAQRRRLRIVKMRGHDYVGAFHDFTIAPGGLKVFPRLFATAHEVSFEPGTESSGLADIDALVGGGLDRGTSLLIVGPAGSGKSSIAAQYVSAAAKRGQRAVVFTFDETARTLLLRTEGLGMGLAPHVAAGRVILHQIDPAGLTPGQFASIVRAAALGTGEQEAARIVVIDSLNGYLNAMPEERFLLVQLHELLTALAKHGVVTILVVAQQGLVGNVLDGPADASYLTDTVLLTRNFEAEGVVNRAVSVIKKRTGGHERTIREVSFSANGLALSPPLRGYRGVMTGTPTPIPAAPDPAPDPQSESR